MTTSDGDGVDRVVAAYLTFLEGDGERPALDHLGPSDQAEAAALIHFLEATRGAAPVVAPHLGEDAVAVRLGYAFGKQRVSQKGRCRLRPGHSLVREPLHSQPPSMPQTPRTVPRVDGLPAYAFTVEWEVSG